MKLQKRMIEEYIAAADNPPALSYYDATVTLGRGPMPTAAFLASGGSYDLVDKWWKSGIKDYQKSPTRLFFSAVSSAIDESKWLTPYRPTTDGPLRKIRSLMSEISAAYQELYPYGLHLKEHGIRNKTVYRVYDNIPKPNKEPNVEAIIATVLGLCDRIGEVCENQWGMLLAMTKRRERQACARKAQTMRLDALAIGCFWELMASGNKPIQWSDLIG